MNIDVRDGAVVIREGSDRDMATLARIPPDRLDKLRAALDHAQGLPAPGTTWVGFEGDDEISRKVNAITFAPQPGVEFTEHRNGLYVDDDFYVGLNGWKQWVAETKATQVEVNDGT